eukprot:GHUV01020223.1.p1 GENE.GHUV01020223.1~~GHUV01020223.1.p1  ORF type:complete len:187 (+),score=4.87 GHUV01020223.1:195-755(+)
MTLMTISGRCHNLGYGEVRGNNDVVAWSSLLQRWIIADWVEGCALDDVMFDASGFQVGYPWMFVLVLCSRHNEGRKAVEACLHYKNSHVAVQSACSNHYSTLALATHQSLTPPNSTCQLILPAGEPELLMASRVLKRPICVYEATWSGPQFLLTYGEDLVKTAAPMHLLWSGAHYDLLVPQINSKL